MINISGSRILAERRRLKAQKQAEQDCKAVGHVKVMTEKRNDGDFDCMCLHCGATWVIPAKEMESDHD